ncbi:MAG: RHS repeat-associated core domain-containing protein [Pyrinomonadaceae bacterium]
MAEYSTDLASTQQVSYLTQDHLGSNRVITNENGDVTIRRDYSAFGEETLTSERISGLGYFSTPSYDETRKGYTGYEKDEESGLDFAQARYYNSTHGRYTSVDPLTASASIRNPQTFNRYSYVLNSPYKFSDPLGLLPSWTGACGQWCRGSDAGLGGGGYSSNDSIDNNFILPEKKQSQEQFDFSSVLSYVSKLLDSLESRSNFPVLGKEEPYDPKKHKPYKPGKPPKFREKEIYDENGKYLRTEDNLFNCHSYTFHDGKGHPGNNPGDRWDNNPEEDLKNYNQLNPNEPNKKGDVLIYYFDKNNNGQFDPGEPILHSAKVKKVDKQGNTVRVKGKEGRDFGISRHHPQDSIRAYQTYQDKPTSRAYFRKQ